MTVLQCHVAPEIDTLNLYVQRVRKVAIMSLKPVYGVHPPTETPSLTAFKIQVEGPVRYVSQLHTLLKEACLIREDELA